MVREEPMIDATRSVALRRVLVVGDESGVRGVIRLALRRAGYSVVEAPGGKLASEMAEAERFDVVIADLAMPGMDGLEAARAIRAANPSTLLIALSGGVARPTPELLMQLSDLAADAVVSKPFLPTQLVKTVSRLLEDRATDMTAAGRKKNRAAPPSGIPLARLDGSI